MKEIIDKGNSFDWGFSSDSYAKYRDIYPEKMFDEFYRLGFGGKDKINLDIGTGTGVIPRFMSRFGGKYCGIDISENQLSKAEELSKGLNIEYRVGVAENIPFDNCKFDSVSAVQCWRYFDKEKAVPEIRRVLKDKGILIIAYMQWLPKQSVIIDKSLNLVKKYNPSWDCFGDRIKVKDSSFELDGFIKKDFLEFDCDIPFTYESWNGRMLACRGVEPSLSAEQVKRFSDEHLEMLKNLTDDKFTLKHQVAIFCFEKR
ncbi:MAG: methyltransferase domain-containing protein [Clostridiales bacterium]|nr:methyltransferase domain-containing protein [Clostridiales bacterium]